MDYLKDIFSHIPFFLMVDGKNRINATRIIEALIIAIIGGIFAGYVAVAKLEVSVQKLEVKVDKIYNDLYRPSLPRN